MTNLFLRENISSPHIALTILLALFTLNQIGNYLVERRYNLFADLLDSRPELAINNIIYAFRNLALLLFGIQASSGFGILYTEWTPLDLKKRIIASSFFVLDLATLFALEFTPKLRNLYCAHNVVTIFRCLVLISTVLIYSSFNFAEMASSNEAIGVEVKLAYTKLSNFLTGFLTVIAASLIACVYFLNRQPNDIIRYFWFIQNDWISFAGLSFLTAILYFYRPKAAISQGFYKNANLAMGSEDESFKNSAKSELSEPLV